MLLAAATAAYVALLATTLGMVPVVAAGWLLARRPLPPAVVAVLLLPAIVPPSLLPHGSTPERVVAAAVLGFPLALLAVRAAFVRVGARWGEVGRALGDAPGETFGRVDLPLAFPGVLAGLALYFARAATIDPAGLVAAAPALLAWASLSRTHDRALEDAGA